MIPRSPTLSALSRELDDLLDGQDDAHWSRVRIVAAAIRPDVDLDDFGAVIRALFNARFCWADLGDCLVEGIALARVRRAQP